MITTEPTSLPGVLLVRTRVFTDERGSFTEVFREPHFAAAGLPARWPQANRSRSRLGVVRGLHFQTATPQAKLVWCTRGRIWDVAVDVRVGSPTFGQWVGCTLDDEPGRALLIPAGFAHGFCALTEPADVAYLCSAVYDPADDWGVAWNDAALGITWPTDALITSAKDGAHPTLAVAATIPGRLPQFA
jgi:dTDP-4-dehydrorhamnose 3,5-epimerase